MEVYDADAFAEARRKISPEAWKVWSLTLIGVVVDTHWWDRATLSQVAKHGS